MMVLRPLAGLGLVTALLLGGCGLEPVYSGGTHGIAGTALSSIEIAPIPNRAGYLMSAALHDRFNADGTARYRLEVELDDQILGFGVRGDNSIARERRTLRARYRLVGITSGTVILDATATSDIGIDRVSSDFAVVAAENTALERLTTDLADQITIRIARFAKTGGVGEK